MGSYIDTAYVESHIRSRHLVALTDTGEKSGIISEVLIDDAITTAESIIEIKIAKYYAVPVTTPQRILDVLRFWALQLVKYLLYQNLMKSVPEDIQAWYDEVMAELEKISEGKAVLQGATAQTGAAIAIAIDKTSDDVIYSQDRIDTY